jgi:hypothetical protein
MTGTQALAIDPDIGPLGPRRRHCEPYPRPFTTLTIPLSRHYQGTLIVPVRLTPFEYDMLVEAIRVMRPGLVMFEEKP